jgi:hypothetical protein
MSQDLLLDEVAAVRSEDRSSQSTRNCCRTKKIRRRRAALEAELSPNDERSIAVLDRQGFRAGVVSMFVAKKVG